nr:helix-turn-helix domain-containing protein [uncultured Oscillibacter sp.]
MDLKAIGIRIRQSRKVKGLTQADLASLIDVSTMSIRRYESGERIVTEEISKRIASALNVDVNWLMNGQTLEERDQVWKDQVARRFEEATSHQKQRSPFKPGESYFGGDMRVKNVTVSPDGKETVTIDMDIGKLSSEDVMGYLEMFNKMAKLGITVDGISRLIDAATNITNMAPNPSQDPPGVPPAPAGYTDTPAAQDAPEGAEEGE